MTYEQYQDQKNEIHWDVQWQLFDKVNEKHDTVKYIDLNCIQLEDAIAITK